MSYLKSIRFVTANYFCDLYQIAYGMEFREATAEETASDIAQFFAWREARAA